MRPLRGGVPEHLESSYSGVQLAWPKRQFGAPPVDFEKIDVPYNLYGVGKVRHTNIERLLTLLRQLNYEKV